MTIERDWWSSLKPMWLCWIVLKEHW